MRFAIILITFLVFTKIGLSAPTYLSSDRADGIVATNPNAESGDESNQLASSLCQLILLLNGRVGRAIAVIALLALAFMFMTDKLRVRTFVIFIVGITFLFGAKSIALTILPSYVYTKDIDRNQKVKKTPDELIREVCPELM
jgi:type IV secretory pathway VirB2 component (pilin)